MAKRIRALWPTQRRNAIELAEEIARPTFAGLPVDLQRIAKARFVQDIKFTRLLTDGGLAVTPDGFIIYVRCELGESDVLNSAFLEDGTGSSLPKKIARRVRFTIAHEIAHTLFFDINARPPRSKLSADDDTVNTKLELACNEIAGLLLLPERVIHPSLTKSHGILPEDLRGLADDAMVSGQTVVRRLGRLRRIDHPEAIIATVARTAEDWQITAISTHYTFREVFRSARVEKSVRDLIAEPDFVLFGGEMREAITGYIGHGGVRKEMHFRCELGSRLRRGHDTIIVGVPARE
jgi:hypothetical protein